MNEPRNPEPWWRGPPPWRLTLTAVFAPRSLFPPGLLADQRSFLEELSRPA
ncbi:hypothetical protein ACGFYY_18730 [Streptomyces sp. NPDC048331]|uniref:hypothetical protein n=1 Tax=Streptomyces sp. NPDC048331 TaxID=3365534 RepID=UPI00371D4A3B